MGKLPSHLVQFNLHINCYCCNTVNISASKCWFSYICVPIGYEVIIIFPSASEIYVKEILNHSPSFPFHYGQERESVRLEDGSHQFPPRDRMRLSGNDSLPGSVLLARERLLQRLRGVTLSGGRLVLLYEAQYQYPKSKEQEK